MKRPINVRTVLILLTCLSISGLLFGSGIGISPTEFSLTSASAATEGRIDTPQIFCASSTPTSINITVCAPDTGTGSSGLPAGFSLQWMTCADFAANGNRWLESDDPRLCKASFSGNAHSSRYSLAPGECITVNVGNFLFDQGFTTSCTGALQCGTCYVFRAFGHATNSLNRSNFTTDLSCSTVDCDSQCDGISCEFCVCCVIDAIHWPVEGPPGCALFTRNQWPVTSLTLGTVTYTDLELCAILNSPANGNGLIALAQELIAAKLNQIFINNQLQQFGVTLCVSYTCEEMAMIARCIADADAVIGGLIIPPHGNGFLDSTATDSLIACLHSFNGSELGVGGCPD
jgi:hypothetical protein